MSHSDPRYSSLFNFLRESAAIRREYEAARDIPCPFGCGWPRHDSKCRKYRPGDLPEPVGPPPPPRYRDEPDPEGVERRRKAVLEAKKDVPCWVVRQAVGPAKLDEVIRAADDGEGAVPPDPRDHPRPGEECKRGCGKKVHLGTCKGSRWNGYKRKNDADRP